MWKGSSKQIGHGGPFRSGVCDGGSLDRTTCSSLCSVGAFGISLTGASNTVVDSTGNALKDAEDFWGAFLTYFRFAGLGGTASLALERKPDNIAAATSDRTLVLALV